jgi:hypothetical protein
MENLEQHLQEKNRILNKLKNRLNKPSEITITAN